MTARTSDEAAIRAAVQRAVDDPDPPPFVEPSGGGKSVIFHDWDECRWVFGSISGGGFASAAAAIAALRVPGARAVAFDRPSAPSRRLMDAKLEGGAR